MASRPGRNASTRATLPQTSPSPRSPSPRILWSFFLLLVACILVPAASATSAVARTVEELARIPTETLVVDHRSPVKIDGQWRWLDEEQVNELRRRQEGSDEEPEPTTTPTPSDSPLGDGDSGGSEGGDGQDSSDSKDREGSETSASATPSSTIVLESPSPLPSPFDNNLDFNFTSNGGKSCPAYLNNLLTSDTFKGCYPLSMMLQTSKSFFDAEKELQSIVTVLDATCAADLDFCTTYLKDEAKKMISPDNCGDEFRRGQPNILQAHLGLTSYNVMYKSACLRDQDNDIYCFANAVTNTSTPANAYFYFLPMNMTLPESSNPACSKCLQDTMAIFQAASANRKQAIAFTYEGAAKQVNTICGPEFVNDTMPPPVEDAGTRLAATGVAVLASMVVIMVNWVL